MRLNFLKSVWLTSLLAWSVAFALLGCSDKPVTTPTDLAETDPDLDVDPEDLDDEPDLAVDRATDRETDPPTDTDEVSELPEEVDAPDEELDDEPDESGPWLPGVPDCLALDETFGCAAPPELADWTCPSGWRTTPVVGEAAWQHNICEPATRLECDRTRHQGPGDELCQRVGTSCPGDERFPSDEVIADFSGADAGRGLFVDGIGPGGARDGTRAKPYRSITAALGVAEDHDVVVLAAGEYDTEYEVDVGLRFVGSCATETGVSGSMLASLVGPSESTSRFANLSVLGPATIAAEDNSIAFDDVRFQGRLLVAPVSQLSVTDSLFLRSLGFSGGLMVDGADEVLLDGVTARGVSVGISLIDVSDGSLTDIVVSDSASSAISIQGSDVTLDRAFLSEADAMGLGISSGSTVQVGDLAVGSTGTESVHYALHCEDATIEASQVGIQGGHGAGVVLNRCSGALEKLRVSRISTAPSHGVRVSESGSDGLSLESVSISGAKIGLWIEDSVVDLIDLVSVVNDTGISARRSDMTGSRLMFEVNQTIGAVFWQGTTARVTDLVSSGNGLPPETGRVGGVLISSAKVTIERAAIRGNRGIGIVATAAAQLLQLEDEISMVWLSEAVVGGNHSYSRVADEDLALTGGYGLAVTADVFLRVADSLFIDNRSVSVYLHPRVSESIPDGQIEVCTGGVDDDGDDLIDCADYECWTHEECGNCGEDGCVPWQALDRVIIGSTHLAECGELEEGEEHSCVEAGENQGGGMALITQSNQESRIRDVLISGAARVGLVIDIEAQLEANDSHIRNNAVGIHIIDTEFDVTRLYDGVFIYDNDIDVARGEVAIPDIESLFEGL